MSEIGFEEAKLIAEGLKGNTSFTKLDLGVIFYEGIFMSFIVLRFFPSLLGNNVGNDGCKVLCDTLKTNTFLVHLNFERNNKQKHYKWPF